MKPFEPFENYFLVPQFGGQSHGELRVERHQGHFEVVELRGEGAVQQRYLEIIPGFPMTMSMLKQTSSKLWLSSKIWLLELEILVGRKGCMKFELTL